MQAKMNFVLAAFLALSISAIARDRSNSRLNAATPASKNGGAQVFERSYELPCAQAEALALVLKLGMPRDTSVKTESEDGSRIIISGPQTVHDAIAPLAALLANERASRNQERAASVREQLIEMQKNYHESEMEIQRKHEALRRRQR